MHARHPAGLLEVIGRESLPKQFGGALDVPLIYRKSRTRTTNVPSGKQVRDVVALPGGVTARFKWYCKPGDIKFSIAFYPANSAAQPASQSVDGAAALGSGAVDFSSFVPAALRSGSGVVAPEPGVRWCLPPADGIPAAEAAALAPLASKAVEVYALREHSASDTAPVVVTHSVPPGGGFYFITYSNSAGWRQRELHHR